MCVSKGDKRVVQCVCLSSLALNQSASRALLPSPPLPLSCRQVRKLQEPGLQGFTLANCPSLQVRVIAATAFVCRCACIQQRDIAMPHPATVCAKEKENRRCPGNLERRSLHGRITVRFPKVWFLTSNRPMADADAVMILRSCTVWRGTRFSGMSFSTTFFTVARDSAAPRSVKRSISSGLSQWRCDLLQAATYAAQHDTHTASGQACCNDVELTCWCGACGAFR